MYFSTYFRSLDTDYITENQKKIDVFKYDLSFDLYPENKILYAEAILTGKILDKNIESIDLNFYDNFEIEKILLNGERVDFVNEDTRLSIQYNPLIGDDFKIKVYYKGTPKKVGLAGFVFGKRNSESLVYNLSEPTYASSWFPCNDLPFDKTFLEMSITNDSSAISISNGILIDVETNGSRKTYTWKTEYPISTYLIAIYSADYIYFSDKYISLNMSDTMNIDYYVLSDKLEEAKIDFEGHVKMMAVLAEMFGEYPFIKEKYGVAEFLWFPGAMEHQTITGVSSNMISGKNFYEDTYVHELAHQWWGNAVSPKSWKDIWLNEGFATYSEALYYEVVAGAKALQSTMMSKYNTNFSGSLANPGNFLFTRTMYDKGAWVLHMLRWEIGDPAFFETLRIYYETFKYSNASISDFKNVCEEISKKNLDKFFEQWVNGEGIIELEYKIDRERKGEKFLVKIYITQVIEDDLEYDFPIEIKISFENIEDKFYRYDIATIDTTIEFSFDQEPGEIDLDPNRWLLAVINSKYE